MKISLNDLVEKNFNDEILENFQKYNLDLINWENIIKCDEKSEKIIKEIVVKFKLSLQIHYEDSTGYWRKKDFENGLLTYFKNSDGDWNKRKYENELETYYSDSFGRWKEKEYKDGVIVSFKESNNY